MAIWICFCSWLGIWSRASAMTSKGGGGLARVLLLHVAAVAALGRRRLRRGKQQQALARPSRGCLDLPATAMAFAPPRRGLLASPCVPRPACPPCHGRPVRPPRARAEPRALRQACLPVRNRAPGDPLRRRRACMPRGAAVPLGTAVNDHLSLARMSALGLSFYVSDR
ncbi:hypothetical protein BS78_04G110800 [Paspalum vaginatum]|nr:hypothetical protein BS78_04G110800 [Paspalum vaginatum]